MLSAVILIKSAILNLILVQKLVITLNLTPNKILHPAIPALKNQPAHLPLQSKTKPANKTFPPPKFQTINW